MVTLSLNDSNFSVQNVKRKNGDIQKVLMINTNTNNFNEFMLVYFKQTRCTACKIFDNIFYEVASTNSTVTFGVISIKPGEPIIEKFKATNITNIVTPFLILFRKGIATSAFNSSKINSASDLDGHVNRIITKLNPSKSLDSGVSYTQNPTKSFNNYSMNYGGINPMDRNLTVPMAANMGNNESYMNNAYKRPDANPVRNINFGQRNSRQIMETNIYDEDNDLRLNEFDFGTFIARDKPWLRDYKTSF
uniref:Thioredoxin domain-containing protein n=1 Tax=viral metagenome TaxID=1070528 RepID=A0A6C0JBJ4_9ZZZZ